MRVRYFLGALFAGRALADLTCQDFVPHNWTSPLTRLYLFNNDDNPPMSTPPTMPANLSATSPLTLAPKKSSGSVFRLRKCTSKSLGLQSGETSGCDLNGKKRDGLEKRQNDNECDLSPCWKSFTNYVQVLDSNGHCFTWQQLSPNLAHYNFVPCNANPTNLSQILTAQRSYFYYTDTDYQPDGVCDWGVDFIVSPNIVAPYNSNGGFQAWELANGNKTLVSSRKPYPNEYWVYAKHHDPLTTYQKKG